MTDGGSSPVVFSRKADAAPADPSTQDSAAHALKPVAKVATAVEPEKASALNQECGSTGGPSGLGTTCSMLGQDQVCPLTQVVSVPLIDDSEMLCCLSNQQPQFLLLSSCL